MSEQQVFSDRYEMVSHIARGGMAQVYLARDLLLDRAVALKVLFPELSVDRSFVERFRREAKAAANLSHPNIVSIYDWGQGERTYFIVMEYIDGNTLSSLLRQGPLGAPQAAAIGADVANALEFAHRRGVIHRDVKPGNVLIDQDGQVKVADFGIARAAGTDGDLTQTGSVMGTATYFSPEQAQGFPVDARSDVYSLGVVLYEMVVGKPPFAGDSPVAIAYKHVKEPPPAPASINHEIPANFEAIVMKALAKDPADRYQTADELRSDLLRFSNGQPVAAASDTTRVVSAIGGGAATTVMAGVGAGVAGDPTRVNTAGGGGTMALPVTDSGYGYGPGGRDGRRRGWFYVLVAAVLIALLVGGYFIGRSHGLFGTSAKTLTVPSNLAGQQFSAAKSELQGLGFTDITEKTEANLAPLNQVISSSPAGGHTMKSNAQLQLLVSAGPTSVKVPDVTGDSLGAAEGALKAAGFKYTTIKANSATVASGDVISTNPAANQPAPQGSSVQITESSGAQQVTIPPLVGDNPVSAGQALGQLGLTVNQATEPSPNIPAGQVTRTSPPAGDKVAVGSTVTVYVSTGSGQVQVPDVTGDSCSAAQSALTTVGLTGNCQDRTTLNPAEVGVVIDESPKAGKQVGAGTSITLYIGEPPGGSTTTTSSPPIT